jgi:FkbM family methyltransferase
MHIILPAAMDLFLLGGKTHDSELRLTRFMINNLSPGDQVADIGAHYGFFSLLAAKLIGSNGRVEAFEASANTYTILRQNLEAAPQANAHHLAISHSCGTLDFYEFPTLYTEYNTLQPEQFAEQKWFVKHPPVVHTVSAKTLDDFCEEQIFQPTFIKIDVEGAEDKVIAGMSRLLAKHHPIIVMEYLVGARFNQAHQQAAQQLKQWGFHPHIIHSDGHLEQCHNIDDYLKTNKMDSDNLVFV